VRPVDDVLVDLDATGLAELVRRGEVQPVELVDAAIARIEALDRQLNAVIHRQYERARREASGAVPDGPFRGVPFLFKDLGCEEAGEPHHQGMRALRDAGWRATADSELALAFRNGGLIPLGRTNTPELALMGTTEPDAYGPTRNPWDPARSPGGSSGGSAAAVAAGLVPAAHATDIAGSIRIPASQCGLVGLKPTRGRVVPGRAADPAIGMGTVGVLTRTVRDTAALLDAITDRSRHGPWPAPPLRGRLATEVGRDPGRLRVGLCVKAFNGAGVDDGCTAAATEAATLLDGLGHDVDESTPAALFEPELLAGARLLLAANAAAELHGWEVRLGRTFAERDVEPLTWQMVQAGRDVSGAEVLAVLDRQHEIARRATTWWRRPGGDGGDGYDILLTPSTAEPGPPLGAYKQGYAPGRAGAFARVFNVTGQPAMSLPLGWPDDGLPRGVQLVAAYGREDVLIRLAARLEAAAPWSHRWPPLRSPATQAAADRSSADASSLASER
jgi:amidase